MSAEPAAAARGAAVLMTMLDDDAAAKVLRLLGPDELREIGRAMIALDRVAPQEVERSLHDLAAAMAGQGIVTPEPEARLERVLTDAHGADRAGGLMARIRPEGRPSALAVARWLDAPVLVRLLAGEHPQVIALLITCLEPERGAAVLGGMAAADHAPLLHRVATLGPVRSDALALLEEILARRIAQAHGASTLTLGGARDAAALLNNAARAMEAHALPGVAAIDEAVAGAIREEMVTFRDLLALDPRSIGAVLRVIDGEVLVLALKGVAEAEREPVFAAMSSRAADGVRDEIETRGRVRMTDVLAAQTAVIAQARALAEAGEIALGGAGGDYV